MWELNTISKLFFEYTMLGRANVSGVIVPNLVLKWSPIAIWLPSTQTQEGQNGGFMKSYAQCNRVFSGRTIAVSTEPKYNTFKTLNSFDLMTT